MFKPFEIFNDVVSNFILGIYDMLILLLFGPIFSLFHRKKKIRFWRFICQADNRLSSLTLLFICTSAVVTKYIGQTWEVIGFSLHANDDTVYSFLSVIIISILITMVLDLLCRLLVYLRTFSLKVVYSKIRLLTLRMTLCFSILIIFIAAQFNVTPGLDSILHTVIVSIGVIPFTWSIFHLTYRARNLLGLVLILPFSFSVLSILFPNLLFLSLAIRFTLSDVLPKDGSVLMLNKECSVTDDKKSVIVEADFLLKSDVYSAVSLGGGNISADLGNQIVKLNVRGDKHGIILLKDKPIHGTMVGALLNEIHSPSSFPCNIIEYGDHYYQVPESIALDRSD